MTIGDSLGPEGKRPELDGVGGWLAFLCVSLLFLTPISVLWGIVVPLTSLNDGAPLDEIGIDIVAGVAIAAFAIFAGIGLVRLWANAVRIAKWYFFITAGLGLLAVTAVVSEPEVFAPAEVVIFVCWLGASLAGLTYLYRSERVRNTYGKNTVRDAAEVFR